jgi:hypothetical protein
LKIPKHVIHFFCLFTPNLRSSDLLPSVGEFVEGIPGDDVPTYKLHGRVALGRLLAEDRTREHRVVPALLTQVDFNLGQKRWEARCEIRSLRCNKTFS